MSVSVDPRDPVGEQIATAGKPSTHETTPLTVGEYRALLLLLRRLALAFVSFAESACEIDGKPRRR